MRPESSHALDTLNTAASNAPNERAKKLPDTAASAPRPRAAINAALDAIRTRRDLKWGVPAMLLTGPYLLAGRNFTAMVCADRIVERCAVRLLEPWGIRSIAKFITVS
ncbi:hypothetical protein AB1K54_10660 [Microbacterium sp. BWT-B31]|uniref:hypothetical protein n=1 Tax=Microbacterium sp. BWT-B31 TaxID=3232072 RepID=UPI0035274684